MGIVEQITLCYYEYFNEQIRQIKQDLVLETGGTAGDTKKVLDMKKKLLLWLKNTPIYLLLQCVTDLSHIA